MPIKMGYYYSSDADKEANGHLVLTSKRLISPGTEKHYFLYVPAECAPVNNNAFPLFLSGETECAPDYYCHFFHPQHACMMYFEKGSGTLRVNDKTYTVKAGDTVFMREENEWEYQTSKDDPWKIYWVNLSHDSVLSLLNIYNIPASTVFPDPELGLTVKKIVDTIKNNTHYVQTLDNVLQYILHFIQHLSLLVRDKRNLKKQARDAYIIMDYINAHIVENIKVSDLSKLVYRSGGGTANAFRAIYNCSIKDYIMRAKLEVAAHLLRANDNPVSEIAEHLSFCDAQHFSRMFHQRYGMSPTKFRKLLRSSDVEVAPETADPDAVSSEDEPK